MFNSLDKSWNNHNDFNNAPQIDDLIYDDKLLCNASPTYGWCIKNELIPEYIFDAAISENGYIAYGIEIVYTNSISEIKKNRIQKSLSDSHCRAVIEIDARWVLEQNGIKPQFFQLERYMTRDEDIVAKIKRH